MSDIPEQDKRSFHEFALNSTLFKGRPDLYFCYLKSERLAHALARIQDSISFGHSDVFEHLTRAASLFPGTLVRFAAGELEEAGILADLFEMLALIRLCVSHGIISEQNAKILASEYELIGQKVDLGKNASPFLALEDLTVPPLPSADTMLLGTGVRGGRQGQGSVKDTSKGHSQMSNTTVRPEKRQTERSQLIFAFIKKNQRVSIKDISKVIKGCSEKTIQRELLGLIRQGLVRKEGERRWSTYIAVSGA